MKRTIRILCILLAVALLIVIGVYAKRWMAIDACLDRGGAWDYQRNACKPFTDRETCESRGGTWNYGKNTCDPK